MRLNDIVYAVFGNNDVCEGKIIEITYRHTCYTQEIEDVTLQGSFSIGRGIYPQYRFRIDNVFSTREEAESKLQTRKEEDLIYEINSLSSWASRVLKSKLKDFPRKEQKDIIRKVKKFKREVDQFLKGEKAK